MTKLLYCLVVFPCMILAGCSAVPDRTGPNVIFPRTDHLVRIYISTPSGWYLRISPDGSADFGYGSAATALLAGGTYDFEAVRRSLNASLFSDGNISDDFAVAFEKENQESTVSYYSIDRRFIGSLFDVAKSSISSQSSSLNEIWATTRPT